MISIINCPTCTKPIIKELSVESASSDTAIRFKTRCPHCHKDIALAIESRVEHDVLIDGAKVERRSRTPRIRSFGNY